MGNIHSIEELDELKKWFEDNRHILPESMQINPSAFSPKLSDTINMLLEQAYIYHDNPKMQGSICILKKIKENITSVPKND